MPQMTLKEQFKDIEWCNYVWGLVEKEDGPLTYVDAWLLCGNYKTMKELPSVEENLDQQLKEDLGTQRILAHPNFRGVVANKPVDMVRRTEDPPYSSQEHIYVDANRFSIEIGNEPFLPPASNERDMIRMIERIIKDMEKEQIGDEVSVEKVLNFAGWEGMNRDKAEEIIEVMKRDGILFTPSGGVVEFVR